MQDSGAYIVGLGCAYVSGYGTKKENLEFDNSMNTHSY